MKALLGTKIGMTQIISQDGTTIPVTLIQAGPVAATQVKSVETDGYNAVQVAYGAGKNLSKAVAGHVKPAVSPRSIFGNFVLTTLAMSRWATHGALRSLRSAMSWMSRASAKVKVGLVRSSGTTSSATAKPTVVRVTRVRSVRSVACTHKRFSKGSAWQARWATSASLSRI